MNYVAFDVETTGTDQLNDDVLQLAAIHFSDDGTIQDRLNVFCKTDRLITDGAFAAHGITKQKLDEVGKQPMTAGGMLLDFIKRTSSHLVGHNIIQFDLSLTWNWILRNTSLDFRLPAISSVFDTMMYAREILGTRKWLKNRELAEALGIEYDRSKLHDAVYDLEGVTIPNFLVMRKWIQHRERDLCEYPEPGYNYCANCMRVIGARKRLPEILAKRTTRPA